MQSRKWMVAATVLAMILSLCACGKKTGLEGRVIDGKGQGVAGVKVIATQVQPVKGYEQFDAVSDTDGFFKFGKLFPASQYVLKPQQENGMVAESVKANSGPEGQVTALPEPLVVHYTVSKGGVPADSAEVIGVKEITKTVRTPREECEDVQVQEQAPVKDSYQVTGTVIGGVAGGLLGNQVGRGRTRTAATVAGAAGGAYVGNQVQKSMQKGDVVTRTKRVCRTVYDTTQKVVGYDVTYRLEGKEGMMRTSFKPGASLPVKNGKVIATPPEAKS